MITSLAELERGSLQVLRQAFDVSIQYDISLRELQRRALFSREFKSFSVQVNDKLEHLYKVEEAQRKAFESSYANPTLFPIFPSLSSSQSSLPPFRLDVGSEDLGIPEDMNLPTEGHEGWLIHFTEIWAKKELASSDEKLRRYEQEKAHMLAIIKDTTDKVASKDLHTPVDNLTKVAELQKQLETTREALSELSATSEREASASTQQIAGLEQQIRQMEQENNEIQERIQQLVQRPSQEKLERELADKNQIWLALESKFLTTAVNQQLFQEISTGVLSGVPEIVIKRALVATNNQGIMQALEWFWDDANHGGREPLDLEWLWEKIGH